jgi:hypothetical protein
VIEKGRYADQIDQTPRTGGGRSPWVTLLREVAARPDITEFSLRRGEERLEWRRG